LSGPMRRPRWPG